MAKVQSPVRGSSSGGVFASVFPPPSIRPPKAKQRFTPLAASEIPAIKADLHGSLQDLLGIGDDIFIYGQNSVVAGQGPPFHSNFEVCAPWASVRPPTQTDHAVQSTRLARSQLWSKLAHWKAAVGSDTMKKLLAADLNDLITEFVAWSYAGVYRDGLESHLNFWVKEIFIKVTHRALLVVDGQPASLFSTEAEVKKWREIAFAGLGALRVDELFEIIVDWDATSPAMDDLKNFTTNPSTRGYLTNNFANVLQTRLLHPGASTIEIIQLYISIIRSFRILDPKGILLDRVSRKLRRYLRERDDTVKVIVTGLLSDAGQDRPTGESEADGLTELALELSRHGSQNGSDDNEFDWNNMSWQPDPIDAAPDYIKSKSTDVISSLITLFDTKEVFVKELQSSLAERFLRNKADFSQEISVLEHLKIRFGDSALQGCEVMLRDVLDSRKVDNVIRRDQKMQDEIGRPIGDGAQLHAKILSRIFWPAMSEQTFNVPAPILAAQQSYETGFEALKQSRKLTWVNAIGQVEVELELTDRTFAEEVLPWQAAVIYAFNDDTGNAVTKSVIDLAAELDMSSTLVRSACIFWVSRRILVEETPTSFSVLETLPTGTAGPSNAPAQDATAAAAAAEAAAQAAAKEAEEDERKQKMGLFHQFIISMLTNQGAMPLPRIAMMLGIVVPGGFPFSNEELKEFLGSMVREGTLEMGNAGAYKIAG